MKTLAAEQFANWLAHDQPALFVELYKRAAFASQGLADISDVLSSIGTGISDAVSNVGSFLTSQQGLTALTSLSSAYLTSTAQKNAVQTQLNRAAAGQTPAAIQTIYNPATGQYQAVVQQPSGAVVPLSPVASSQFIQGVPNWVLGAGGGLLILALMLSLRR